MGGTFRVEQRPDVLGAGRGLGDVLRPGPGPVPRGQPGPVVVGPREEQLAEGRHAGSAASERPTWRACSVAPPYAKSKRLAVVK